MINYWWVTRPKRRLNAIPEVLACCAKVSLDQEWRGRRDTHLLLEEELEASGIKTKGERRDQKGGGGLTYLAWASFLSKTARGASSSPSPERRSWPEIRPLRS